MFKGVVLKAGIGPAGSYTSVLEAFNEEE